MSHPSMSAVSFHSDTLYCVTLNNEPYTAMKPIIENMGLDWRTQATKIRKSKDRWGVVMMTTPSRGGQQETLCMPVRKLPAFLNTINARKVRPELRAKLELYQRESDDVLWAYWIKRQKSLHAPKEKDYSTMKLIDALEQVEVLMDKSMRAYRARMCPYVQTMTANAACDDAGLQTQLMRQAWQDTYLAAEHLKLALRHTTFAHETARALKRVLDVPGRMDFF